ncbi:MAG: DUF1571 domain-containing protein [Phycisphaerae bacterium]|nr:DUF1571 domain-containing protein [Phycisphaerae bacterium]
MKKYIGMIFRPSNKGVRVLVGLLLVVLMAIQVTQCVTATPEVSELTIVRIGENEVVTDNQSRLEKITELAKTDHLALLKMCQDEFNRQYSQNGYTCTFVKQERIREKMSKEQHINVKFRPEPFSVAMLWIKNAPIGDSLVYVEGKYLDDHDRTQMVVRPKNGLIQKLVGGSVKKLPDGREAMKKTLRPCTEFGFANSIQSLIDIYAIARERGECIEEFTEGFADIDGRSCIILTRFLPERKDYPAKKTLVFIDVEYLLPVRVVGYDWKDRLSCNYEFKNVQLNVPFNDEDFTPAANDIVCKD